MHAGLGQQFVVAGHGFHVAGGFADPDRQRRAPVALAAEGPIDVRFEKIAEPAVANVLRQPVDAAVVGEHLLFELRGADEPALPRILDQRILFGPPAERVFVQILLLVEQQPAAAQLARDVFVGFLDPAAGVVGRFGGEAAIGSDGADQLGPFARLEAADLGLQHLEVDLAEGRRLVHDARAAVDGDELGRHHAPGNVLPAADLEPALLLAEVSCSSNRTAAGTACRPDRLPWQRGLDRRASALSWPRAVRPAPTRSTISFLDRLRSSAATTRL